MATYTSFEDTRTAFAAVIVAQLATDGVTGVDVFAHKPVGEQTREDKVWIGNIRFSQEPLTYGNYEESLDIDVVVVAPTHGGSTDEQNEGERRAETIFDSIMKSVRDDITIGAAGFNVELTQAESSDDYADGDGPVGYITATFTSVSHL